MKSLKDLVIIGGGGNAQECLWVAQRINQVHPQWNILGFTEKNLNIMHIDSYQRLGDLDWLASRNRTIYCVCSIANISVRRKIVEYLSDFSHIQWATLVDPSAIIHQNAKIGKGSVIFPRSIISSNVSVGSHVLINMSCIVSHESHVGDYCSIYGGVSIAGNVKVNKYVEIGMGTNIIQGLTIGQGSVIGAGAVIISNIEDNTTNVGVPSRVIKNNI